MTVCPVCAHQQLQGLECEVCGKQLGQARVADAPVAALPELERTSFPAATVAAVVPLADLETTGFVTGPDLPAVRIVDVEPTAFSPIGAVPAEAMADLDRARHLDPEPPTALPLQRVCRYCKNVQAEGNTCDRCGMLLPGKGFASPAGAVGPTGEGQVLKCLQCGTRVEAGAICSGCGIVA